MSNFNIASLLLFFWLISGFFTNFMISKYINIQEQKDMIHLMSFSFIPESFIFRGYTFECITSTINEEDIIGKERTIIYFTEQVLSFECEDDFFEDFNKVQELQSFATHRCIIEKEENFLCSRFNP